MLVKNPGNGHFQMASGDVEPRLKIERHLA
jgi:hypothetical protein